MSVEEMAILLAEIQVGDNRNVDELTIAYWHNTIGDMTLPDAQDALRRFRREMPGTYLEPGHLLQLAGVSDGPSAPESVPYDLEFKQAEARRVLALMGKTEADYVADPTLRVAVIARMEQRAIEGGGASG